MSTEWIYSVVLLIPASLKDDANLIAYKMGYGENNFSVQLSSNGQSPATWYGCRTQAQQSFVDILLSAQNSQLPEIEDVSSEVVVNVFSSVIADISEALDGYSHFNQVLQAQNLERVQEIL